MKCYWPEILFVTATVVSLCVSAFGFGQCPGGNCPSSRAVVRTRAVQFFAQTALPTPALPVAPAKQMPVGPGPRRVAIPPCQTPEPPVAPRLGDVVQRLHEKRMARIERRHEVAVGVVKTAVAVAKMPVKAMRAFRFGLRCP